MEDGHSNDVSDYQHPVDVEEVLHASLCLHLFDYCVMLVYDFWFI